MFIWSPVATQYVLHSWLSGPNGRQLALHVFRPKQSGLRADETATFGVTGSCADAPCSDALPQLVKPSAAKQIKTETRCLIDTRLLKYGDAALNLTRSLAPVRGMSGAVGSRRRPGPRVSRRFHRAKALWQPGLDRLDVIGKGSRQNTPTLSGPNVSDRAQHPPKRRFCHRRISGIVESRPSSGPRSGG